MSSIPTAPNNWPLLGHLPALIRSPLSFVQSAYSLGPITLVRIGHTTAYLVNDPELIRQVLVRDVHSFDKGVQYEKLGVLLGNALATSSGTAHRDRRRMMQPAFHRQQIARYQSLMRDAATAMADSWHVGDVVDVVKAMHEIALTVVARALCSLEMSTEDIAIVHHDLPLILRGVAWRVLSPIPALERLPLPTNRRFAAANARLRSMVDRLIQRYREAGGEHDDLLSMLLHARDPQTQTALTDAQIRDEIVNIFSAGAETTGNALAWTWYELARHPRIASRINAAADDQDYLMRVNHEILRLYPPTWVITRRVREPVRLAGHELPAGAAVLFSPYALQRDPAMYPAAERFDPDRWLPERAHENPRHAFLSFGAGPHNCIGEGFALLEMATVVSTIAERFRLVPVSQTKEKALATLVPSQLHMRVTLAERAPQLA